MENKSRAAFRDLIEARIAEWEKGIQNLEHRLAKKDDPEARDKVALMKGRLPELAENARKIMDVPVDSWPNFKSETDLILENLEWLSGYVMKRIGAA